MAAAFYTLCHCQVKFLGSIKNVTILKDTVLFFFNQLVNCTGLVYWSWTSLWYISDTWAASSCFTTVLTTLLFFNIIGPDSTCQHPSVKTYSGSTQPLKSLVKCTYAPSLPAVSPYNSGSRVPLGMSLVIQLFEVTWFMSAFRGREKGTHFYLLSLALASQLIL